MQAVTQKYENKYPCDFRSGGVSSGKSITDYLSTVEMHINQMQEKNKEQSVLITQIKDIGTHPVFWDRLWICINHHQDIEKVSLTGCVG